VGGQLGEDSWVWVRMRVWCDRRREVRDGIGLDLYGMRVVNGLGSGGRCVSVEFKIRSWLAVIEQSRVE